MSQNDAEHSDDITEKAKYLLRTYTQNGKPYKPQDVERLSGKVLDDSWIYKLLNGQIKRPNLAKLKDLSDFFGVPGEFWIQPINSEATEIAVVPPRNSVHALTLRANALTEQEVWLLIDVADALIKRRLHAEGNKQRNST